MFGRKNIFIISRNDMGPEAVGQSIGLAQTFTKMSEFELGIVVTSATSLKNQLLEEGYDIYNEQFAFEHLEYLNEIIKTGYKKSKKSELGAAAYLGIAVMTTTIAAYCSGCIHPALLMWEVLERGFPYVEPHDYSKGIEDLPNLLKRAWEKSK